MAKIKIEGGAVVPASMEGYSYRWPNSKHTVDVYGDGAGATVWGGENSDKITVAAGATNYDIFSDSGNDTVVVKGTVNRVSCYTGNNKITIETTGIVLGDVAVGEGKSTINVKGRVEDTVMGDNGNDTITVAKGGYAKSIIGWLGNNTITVNGYAEDVSGGEGDDKITINGSADKVYGFEGADKITVGKTGYAGVIYSGEDNDVITINGSSGDIYAGAGDDKITLNWANYKDSIVVDTGSGNDTLTIKGAKVGVFKFWLDDYSNLVMMDTRNDRTITVNGWESKPFAITFADGKKDASYITTMTTIGEGEAYGDARNNTITLTDKSLKIDKNTFTITEGIDVYASDGADTIKVTKGKEHWIHGGNGNDKITVSGGEGHFVIGDDGNDTITVSGGYYIAAFGDTGNDIINVTGGNEVFTYGEDGDDTITVSAGVKGGSYAMEGGSGSDTYKITKLASGGYYFIYNEDGGSNDKLDLKKFKSTEFEISSDGEDVHLVHKKTQATIFLDGMSTDALSIDFKDKTATAAQVKGVLNGGDLFPAPTIPDKPSTPGGGERILTSADSGSSSNPKNIKGSSSVDKYIIDGAEYFNLQTLGGNDIVNVKKSGNAATIFLGAGNDTIDVHANSVNKDIGFFSIISGDAGNDTINIYGPDANQPFVGQWFNVTAFGGDGDDTFYVDMNRANYGYGQVALNGGNGADTFTINWKGTQGNSQSVLIGDTVGENTKGTDRLIIQGKNKDFFTFVKPAGNTLVMVAKDGSDGYYTSSGIQIVDPEISKIATVKFDDVTVKLSDILKEATSGIGRSMMTFNDAGVTDTGVASSMQQEQPVLLAFGTDANK